MVVALKEVLDVAPRHQTDEPSEYDRDEIKTAVQLALLNERFEKMDLSQGKWQNDLTAQVQRLVDSMQADASNLSAHIVHSDADRSDIHRSISELRQGQMDQSRRLDGIEHQVDGSVQTKWIRLIFVDGWKTIASLGVTAWAFYQLAHAVGWLR